MAPKGYPVSVATRARELVNAGWNLADTRRILKRELGVDPNERTIRRWSDEAFAERRRIQQRKGPWRRPHTRALELRGLGLSCRAIALLLAHDHGVEVSEEQVRYIVDGGASERTVQRLLVPSEAAA